MKERRGGNPTSRFIAEVPRRAASAGRVCGRRDAAGREVDERDGEMDETGDDGERGWGWKVRREYTDLFCAGLCVEVARGCKGGNGDCGDTEDGEKPSGKARKRGGRETYEYPYGVFGDCRRAGGGSKGAGCRVPRVRGCRKVVGGGVCFVLFFFFLGGADTHDFREDVCVCMRQR